MFNSYSFQTSQGAQQKNLTQAKSKPKAMKEFRKSGHLNCVFQTPRNAQYVRNFDQQ